MLKNYPPSIYNLILRVEESVHLHSLQLLWSLARMRIDVLIRLHRALLERRGQDERGNSTTVVSDEDDLVDGVERNVQTLRLLHGRLFAKMVMFLLVQIVQVQLAGASDCREDSRTVRSPIDISDSAAQIKGHDGSGDFNVPKLDRPVSRARHEHSRVEMVPLHTVDCQIMSLERFEVLSGVGLRAEVNFAFFCAHQEFVVVEFVEVEAHSTCKTVEESLFFVFDELAVLVDDELQLDDFLCLELVLHECPGRDTTIGGDGVEVQVLGDFFFLPVNLPHGVSMFVRADGRLVDWFVRSLNSDIVNHDCSIITTNC